MYQDAANSTATHPPNHNNHINARLERIEQSLRRLELKGANERPTAVGDDLSGDEQFKLAPIPASRGHVFDENVVSDEVEQKVENVWTEAVEEDSPEGSPNSVDTVSIFSPSPLTAAGEQPIQPAFLGLTAGPTTLTHLHPDETGIFRLWQMYLENVDPVIKIFHAPSTQAHIMQATRRISEISPTFECIMFAIYFAAVTSCQSCKASKLLLNEDRHVLLARYRQAFEHALARVNFMSAPTLPVLQALALFLICARHSVDKVYIWSMTGLLIRLANRIGLHRDPNPTRTDPFTAEMRRRLWWQILILDVRVAEKNDLEPSIYEHQFDTALPANVNDSDLDPLMTRILPTHEGYSDMLYTLCRFKISYAARMLVFSNKFLVDNKYSKQTIAEKNQYVNSLQKDLAQMYLDHCDLKVPIQYLTVTSCKAVMTKLKLTINHPSQRCGNHLTAEQRLQLVKSSVDILNYARYWRSDEHYSKWSWLFESYLEWDATAFLLHSLSTVQLPTMTENAWNVINTFFSHWTDRVEPENTHWSRLLSLKAKALAYRDTRFNGAMPPLSDVATHSSVTTESDPSLLTNTALPYYSQSLVEPSTIDTSFPVGIGPDANDFVDDFILHNQSDWSLTQMEYTNDLSLGLDNENIYGYHLWP